MKYNVFYLKNVDLLNPSHFGSSWIANDKGAKINQKLFANKYRQPHIQAVKVILIFGQKWL